jgi:outer membrane receptor protein involved in Fe transport
MDAHVQASVVYTGSAYQDLRSADRAVTGKLPQYTTVDFAAGIKKDSWRVEAFAKNLFDDDGQLKRYVSCAASTCTRVYTVPIRPREIGIRVGQDF